MIDRWATTAPSTDSKFSADPLYVTYSSVEDSVVSYTIEETSADIHSTLGALLSKLFLLEKHWLSSFQRYMSLRAEV